MGSFVFSCVCRLDCAVSHRLCFLHCVCILYLSRFYFAIGKPFGGRRHLSVVRQLSTGKVSLINWSNATDCGSGHRGQQVKIDLSGRQVFSMAAINPWYMINAADHDILIPDTGLVQLIVITF